MVNIGVAPPDLETDVGRFRQNTQDMIYTELDPPQVGYGDYEYNSDTEIEGWLAQGNGSLYWALAWYFESVATEAALKAKNIKDHDLAVNTVERAKILQEKADKWFAKAKEEDAELGLDDIFEVSNINYNKRPPEGMNVPVF